MKLNSIERNHSEWLTLVDINGPFLSISVLTDHYPNGIDRVTPEAYQDLKEGFAEWEGSQKANKPNPEMHSIWMKYVLKVLLGFSKEILNKEQVIESTKYQHLKMDLGLDKIYPDYLIPDVEYREEIGKAKLAVFVYPSSQDTREKFIGDAKLDSPLSRASQYLKSTGVPFALVTNGSRWTLIHTGKSELTGYASWESKIWVEERIHLDSFYTLLRKERFFGLSPERTLEKLYEKSRNDQQDVTEQISLQVRNAIEIYIQNLDRINVGNEGKLLKDISESKIYEAALTLMMRLLVLFFAEENKFLQSENELYENFYSISRLGEELRKVADQKGEEVLERRYDAYARLIACFRLIFEGSSHPELPVVAYGGSLFDPNRFPFLEGRVSSEEQVSILKIDNRTTLHLLEALQFLQTKLPGDTQVVARRMSFKSLDIEDIGHIYESLLEYTAKRADKITLSFQATRSQSVKFTLEEVEAVSEKELVDFFKTETGRTENFIKRALKGDIDYDKGALDAACQDPKLTARIRRYAPLLQKDSYNRPVILQKDAIYIDFGSSRRSTGTHYTPAELTKTVVINLLECLVFEGVREGKPRKDWKLKSPEEILKLKVCDISMGSGAFLVQVCRYLAERLLESWQALEGNAVLTLPYGKPSTGNAKEELLAKDKKEREAQALRLIADRCIYGVDLNPLAVEMAKVSLWLVTMQKDKPFTFLDHALKCGDSLLGLEFSEFKRLTQITDKEGNLAIEFYNSLIVEYMEALDLRKQILELDDNNSENIRHKENLHSKANDKLTRIKAGCDLFIGAILIGLKDSELTQLGMDISLGKEADNKRYPAIREMLQKYKPFHWELEFPEVFGQGFDAFAGNPPFMGGQKITGALGVSYRDYLVERLANKQKGSADLSSYFFLRAFRFLSPSGVMGLIATNTIAQGDTREIGLESILAQKGTIYRAVPSMEWPNAAAVFVSICWITRGDWKAGAVIVDMEGRETFVPTISAYLSPQRRVEGKPYRLKDNENKSFQGSIVLGMGFVLEPEEAKALIAKNPANEDCLYPYLNGEDLNSSSTQSPSRWVINFFDWPLERSISESWWEGLTEEQKKKELDIVNSKNKEGKPWFTFFQNKMEEHTREYSKAVLDRRKKWLQSGIVPNDYPYPVAKDYPDLILRVEKLVKPERQKQNDKIGQQIWWRYLRVRGELYSKMAGLKRTLVIAIVNNKLGFSFSNIDTLFTHRLAVFPSEEYFNFSIIQSTIHYIWAWQYSSTLKADINYSPSDCFETFPFPDLAQNSGRLEEIGKQYYELRQQIMQPNSEGLTKTYNRFHSSKPLPYPQFKNDEKSILESEKKIQRLRDLHIQMDYAVRDAYGWNDLELEHGFHETKQGVRFTVSDRVRVEILDRLLELNHKRYAEELPAPETNKPKTEKKIKKQDDTLQPVMFDIKKKNEVAVMLDLHTLPLEQLYFDPNNYRLRKEMNFEFFGEGELCKPEVQQKTKLDIGGEKIKNPLFGEEKIPKNITDLMTSFKSIGYLKINPLIVRKIEGESDKYLVVDGNRRLAALKELRNSWAHGGNIGALNPEIFNNIPINLLEENEDVDTIVGINHLAGSKSWSAINQARFLEHLVIARGDSNKISDELGLNKSFFQNSIRVLIIINKYKESDYAFQWEDNKYSLFQEIMISKSIKYWLDWNTETNEIKNTSNLEKLFSLISKEEAFDENGKEISYEPVLARTKDIRDFSRLVENDAATSYLIENRDLYKTLRKFGIADEPENLPTTIDTINRSLDVLFGSVDALTKDDRLAILKIIDNLNRFKTEKLNSLSDALPSIEQRKNNMVNILPKKGEFPIESFKISKYKKFQDFELNNLSRINIFAGKNNSGKSSLLEAIYINTFLTDIRGIMDVTQKRARLSNLYTDKKWILDNVTTDFLVSIKNKNQDYSVQANIGDNISPEKNISGFFKTIVLKAICAEEKIDSFNYLYFNKDNIINGQLKYICPSIYTSPFTFSKSELVEECYALTFSNKRIFENETIFEKVVNFIKKNVDSNITDIRLIEGPLTFWVIYNNQDTKDLAQSGDGLQRLFYLALLFANCENGVVCIDEFESAIYFGLLEKFTKLVQELAVEFNVQVFLTTHSKECVDAFILNDFRTEDISAYTLLPKKDGTVTAFYYSGDKLKRLIEKLDTDVRTL